MKQVQEKQISHRQYEIDHSYFPTVYSPKTQADQYKNKQLRHKTLPTQQRMRCFRSHIVTPEKNNYYTKQEKKSFF